MVCNFALSFVQVFIGAYELGLGSIPWIIMSEVNISGQQCGLQSSLVLILQS